MWHYVKPILLVIVGLFAIAPAASSSPVTAKQSRWRIVQTWPPLPPGIRFGTLHAVAIDRLERILILHRGEPPVVRLNRDGSLGRAWGTGMFKEVHGLKIAPDGCIWVTDVARHIIVRFSEEGQRLQTLGTPDQPGEASDHLGGPADLAFLPNGDFYVADGYLNSRVIKFDKNGRYLFQWGKAGERAAEFRLPHSIAVDFNGRVYVADRGNKRIQVFESDGKFITEWRIGTPYGLLFAAGQLWMTDMPAKRVMRIDATGGIEEFFPTGVPRSDASDLYVGPHLLAAAPDGSLFVAQTTGVLSRFKKY
jgi:sugar lactone lactonase YvrE